MRLGPAEVLRRRELPPVILVAGDEPLQLAETLDGLRARARELGCNDREVFDADASGFDWNRLAGAGASLSLFADRRLFELRLGNGSIGREGGDALVEYCAAPPDDIVLLATCQRFDATLKKNRWVTAIDRAGAVVEVSMPGGPALEKWLGSRMQARGLEPDRDALRLLAERVEGNLVAAAQEIEKLVLLGMSGPIAIDDLLRAVSDSARFTVYHLVDAVLDGDLARSLRVLESLRGEGTAQTLVTWALAREMRAMAAMAPAVAAGRTAQQVMGRHGVWSSRTGLVGRALRRADADTWRAALGACARADRIGKGQAQGDAWLALRDVVTRAAGGPALAG